MMNKFVKPLALPALFVVCAMMATAAPKPKLKYVDASTLTIINKAQPGTGAAFQRIDVDKYPTLTAKVNEYYDMSTGMAVVFKTNSKNIYAKWKLRDKTRSVNTTNVAQKGLDIYIKRDGKWIFAGVAQPKPTGADQLAELVVNMDTTTKECMAYLPLYDSVSSLELGVDSASTITAIPNPFTRKVVVVGSSITHGIGVSRPGMAYPARLERMLDMEMVNLGASGQCKLDKFYADIVADTEADVFIFDAFSNPSAEQINERFEAFVKRIREAHPTTPLIFLQTEVRENGNFNLQKRQFEAEKRAAAEANIKKAMATDKNIYFINPGMPLGDDHDATVDGIHPTDLGMDRMLTKIAPQIKKIINKTVKKK